jgi:hypothetical protein
VAPHADRTHDDSALRGRRLGIVSDGGDRQRIEAEPLRLLAAKSEYGYVERVATALRDEPEAVSESFQRQLTHDAQRREREQRVAAWKTAHATITSALGTFKQSCRIDPPLANALRSIERQAVALDRRVAR